MRYVPGKLPTRRGVCQDNWPPALGRISPARRAEEILRDTGIPYAIIWPALAFGEGDLLLNNMAWALRRFPVFIVFGDGDCQVQPIHAEDLAAQGWRQAVKSRIPLPTPPGRRPLALRNCCPRWPRRWAPGSGWRILRHLWCSPDPAGRPRATGRCAEPRRG